MRGGMSYMCTLHVPTPLADSARDSEGTGQIRKHPLLSTKA
jgi:hypothetical protein